MPSQSQKNSETLIRLEARIETIENNHLTHIQTAIEKIERHISSIWKVVGLLCFMFTIVFAETVKSFVDLLVI
jgi:hypothetical protein